MTEPTPSADAVGRVAERLAGLGLIGELFDATEVAAQLAERLELDGGLDALIGPGDPGPPATFDPRGR